MHSRHFTRSEIIHATAIVYEQNGVLICGDSGSGKSTLALELMALGADLIADDAVIVYLENDGDSQEMLWLSPARNPELTTFSLPLSEQIMDGYTAIEARGVGLLGAKYIAKARFKVMVDLNSFHQHRLPKVKFKRFFDQKIPVLALKGNPSRAAIVIQMLRGGLINPD